MFPDDIYVPREKENVPAHPYVPADKTTGFAEDFINLDEQVVAIETELGTDPPAPGLGRYLRLNSGNSPLQEILKHIGAYWLKFKNFENDNTDLVPASSYPGIITTGGHDVGSQLNFVRDILSVAHDYTVRQDGECSQVKFFVNTGQLTNVLSWQVKIWRFVSGTRYELVGTSENIIAQLTAGEENVVDFATPLDVKAGDLIGHLIVKNGVSNNTELKADDCVVGQVLGFSIAVSGEVDWSTATVLQNEAAIPVVAMMTAPQLVVLGESIQDGFIDVATGNYSLIDNRPLTHFETSLEYQIKHVLQLTSQNYAFGGSTFLSPSPFGNSISERWVEVVALKPKTVVLGSPVNDLIASSDLGDVLDAYATILDSAVTNGIFVFCLSIAPSTGASNEVSQQIDDWNTAISALIKTYQNTLYIDSKQRIGQFRVGGAVGNLWDLITDYDGDGLHLSEQGYRVYADFVLEHMAAVVLAGVSKFEQVVSKAGFTNNVSGRLAELCRGEKIGFFGGQGNIVFFGNNIFLNKQGKYEVRSDEAPGTVKAGGFAIADGHAAFYIADDLTDGDILEPADLAPYLVMGWNKDHPTVYKTNDTLLRGASTETGGVCSTFFRIADALTGFGDNVYVEDGDFKSGAAIASHFVMFAGKLAFYSRSDCPIDEVFTSVLRFMVDADGTPKFTALDVKGLVQNDAGGILTGGHAWVGHLYSAVSVATVTATGGANLHTLPIPANFWYIGRTLRLSTYGVISTDLTPGNITYAVKIGSTIICTTGLIGATASLTNMGWNALVEVTCVNISGNDAILEVQGQVRLSITNGTAIILEMKNTATKTVVNNSEQTFATNVNFSSAGNSITERTFILESMNDLVV